MTDIFTREKRSEIMSGVQGGYGNKMEMRVHNWLIGEGIDHEMYPKIDGHPDVLLKELNVYLFLDGCFWHCCPKHYRRPKSRRDYWIPHLEESNERRELLRDKLPYEWIRIWEHDIKGDRFKEIILDIIGE